MAGVVSGDHVHESQLADALLEGSQIVYWLVLTAIRAGHSDVDIADAITAGAVKERDAAGELPPRLRALADEWQRAFFRDLPGQIVKTIALLSLAAAATDSRISTMIERDLAELRTRPYLTEYFPLAPGCNANFVTNVTSPSGRCSADTGGQV